MIRIISDPEDNAIVIAPYDPEVDEEDSTAPWFYRIPIIEMPKDPISSNDAITLIQRRGGDVDSLRSRMGHLFTWPDTVIISERSAENGRKYLRISPTADGHSSTPWTYDFFPDNDVVIPR